MIITLTTFRVCGWISLGYPVVESSAEILGLTETLSPASVSLSCEGNACRGTLTPLLFAGRQSNTKH